MAKLMNWIKFEQKLKEKNLLIFSSLDIQRLFKISKISATFLLFRYLKKGLITRLKKDMYALSDKIPSELLIANKIYEPSYISLEFALFYHGIIPETVYEITSVTTKATRNFIVLGKSFSYRKIKKEAFTGYIIEKDGSISFRIADAEKAFVDLHYYRLLSKQDPLSRFNKKKISIKKAIKYARLFNNTQFLNFIRDSLQ